MTATIYTPNAAYAGHLEEVIALMETMGSPTIRAKWAGDCYYAIEGSHRVAAAAKLGIPVIIVEVDNDDEISNHDFSDLQNVATVRDIMEYCDWMTAVSNVEISN